MFMYYDAGEDQREELLTLWPLRPFNPNPLIIP